ncbi:GNAT family N-acetyltransferase [Roseiconus nitratireducens]|nr:GNAT family N-acetyltransferase [Roseiconus nitratireducens]
MQPQFGIEPDLTVEEFIDILRRSTLDQRRPVDDVGRMARMLRAADVIATARRDDGKLIGIARAISDRAYCTYLSDLAVDVQHQRQGIGGQLVDLVHREAGLETTLILLAAPASVGYYPKIGMEAHQSCWIRRPVDPITNGNEQREQGVDG